MLRNLQLRTKVLAVVLAPALALVAVVGVAATGALGDARAAARVATRTSLVTDLSPVVDAFQTERALVAVTLRQADDESAAARLFLDRRRTDRALAGLNEALGAVDLDGASDEFAVALRQAKSQLDGADEVRAVSGSADAQAVTGRYTTLIESLLAVSGEVAPTSGSQRLVGRVTSYVALQRTKELVARETDLLGGVFARNTFAGDDYPSLVRLEAERELELRRFTSSATPGQVERYTETYRGSSVDLAADKLAVALASPTAPALGVEATQWLRNRSQSLELLAAVETGLAEDLLATARTAEREARTEALAYVVGALVVLVAAAALVALVTRSITRPLHQLTMAADAARADLPRLVAEMQHSDQQPDAPAPIVVQSRDELGRLAAAFNGVNAVALEVAGQQAALRANIAEMIVNLARRNQSLLGRQLKLLDRLEAEERDPEALEGLFRLDNLATRMRRNAESLLVLAGSNPGRTWRSAVPLDTVVRAAVSEVERYDRIDVAAGLPVGIDGAAAASITHLLAELLENATTFSPPASRVSVTYRRLRDSLLVVVADEGVGMDDRELEAANTRIAHPPLVDAAVSKVLGFSVVGRIAERFAVRVELHRSPLGGIVALVALPSALLEEAAVAPAPAPVTAPSWPEGPADAGGAGQPVFAGVAVDAGGVSTLTAAASEEPGAPAPVAAPTGAADHDTSLARRVPGATVHQPRRTPTKGAQPSPERTRQRLSGFQQGFERGAGGPSPAPGAPERQDP